MRSSDFTILFLLMGILVLDLSVRPAMSLAKEGQSQLLIEKQAVDEKICSLHPCSKAFEEEWAKAKKGDAEAQNKVGEMLHFAEGVQQNYAEALRWYLLATEKNHAIAANHIGRIYVNGEGVSQDPAEGCHWYIKSGEWGDPAGMMNAAYCYRHGNKGFEKDAAKASEWDSRAEKARPGIHKEYEKLLKKLNDRAH